MNGRVLPPDRLLPGPQTGVLPRIAYFSDLTFPSQSVATLQIVKTVEALTRLGAKIDVFIPVPWSRRRMEPHIRLEQLRTYYGISPAVQFVELNTSLPMTGRIHRPIFSLTTLRTIAGGTYELVYVRNFMHARLALRMGSAVLFETYRFRSSREDIITTIEILNRSEKFRGVIVHSELARRYWLYLGADPAKVHTVHNGVDVDSSTGKHDQKARRSQLGLPPSTPVITYAGNTDVSKGIESIFHLASRLPEFFFQIVGVNPKRDYKRLRTLAGELNCPNIKLINWLPPADILPYLFSSDALIIPPTAKPLLQNGTTVLPIKTYTYLATGIPVIAPRLPDTSDVLHHEENAFLLEPDRPERNAAAIRELFLQPQLLQRIGAAGRLTAGNFTWSARAEKIISILQRRTVCPP